MNKVSSISLAVTPGERRMRMLRTAMGPAIAAALEDPDVIEVLLNPAASLCLDRRSGGRRPTGITFVPNEPERIIPRVAAHLAAPLPRSAAADRPQLSGNDAPRRALRVLDQRPNFRVGQGALAENVL